MQDGFIATRHGRIHYLTEGEGKPLFCLHSNGCSAHNFDPVMTDLARTRRIIAWDMPGHGDSDPLTRHYTVNDYADAVVGLMDALGIARADFIGLATGGVIAVALGANHANRVESLVIVDAPARTAEENEREWPRLEQNFGVPTQTPEQLAARFRAPDADFQSRWNIDRNKAGTRTMIDVMWALRDYDALSAAARITAPALVVFGARGPNAGKASRFRQAMPQAQQDIMNDCGHYPSIDDPAGFVALVNPFLDRSTGAKSGEPIAKPAT